MQEDGDRSQAAIAGARNAKIYDLEVLEEAIQDNKHNETRFIIVSGEKKYLARADKISICFELPNEKGSLYHTLSHFIFNGLNMSRIESRPLPGKNWGVSFFVDFAGNLREEAVQNALVGLAPRPKDCGFWVIIERICKDCVDTAERKGAGDETFCFYLYRILRDYFEDFPGK